MKFGRNLPRNQVPEWDASYIKYKPLKKLIKSAIEDAKEGEGSDTAEFFFFLDRNLEDVDIFYNRKSADAARRLKLLQDRYGRIVRGEHVMDREEVEDLMGALLELRGLLRKLQWYGEVNRRGFVKITKKLDKKVGQIATQKPYLKSKVEHKQFATNADLNEMVKTVNEWLARIQEIPLKDDGSSEHSGASLRRVPSGLSLSLPPELFEALEHAVRANDASALAASLSQCGKYETTESRLNPGLCLNLLQRAISARAKSCIQELLSRLETLDEVDDINGRNCLHRFIIAIGRSKSNSEIGSDDNDPQTSSSDVLINGVNYLKPAAAPIQDIHACVREEHDAIMGLQRDEEAISLFEYLLDNLSLPQRTALQAKDGFGRIPLHYAAQYGFVPICKAIVVRMQAWEMFESDLGVDETFEPDNDGYAPLHLAVAGGHPETTKLLIDTEIYRRQKAISSNVASEIFNCGGILATAVKSDFKGILTLLVGAGIDVDYQDDQGETALHIAARLGHAECARILTGGTAGPKADTEKAEKTFGWTPLHVASVDGHLNIIECLIDAGATMDKLDHSGWTAREHAALRGHMKIAQRLADVTQLPTSLELQPAQDGPVNGNVSGKGLTDRTSCAQTPGNGTITHKRQEPIKSFGHRYLHKETMIMVSLGSMDMRKDVQAVNLDRIPLTDAHSTQLDSALSIIVSASGANGEPSIIDLPIQDNISTDPIVFTASDAAKVKLLFDIVPTYAGSSNQIIGRGVALLSSIRPSIGSQRMSLQGDLAAPIVAAQTMDVIGSVHFNFLIITPFANPNMAISEENTYWKSMTSTMLIGHRGLGKNSASRNSLQLGENTIQSFIAAANLGASYVEFDVQLTKDLVPVIYHDFLVSETGIDAPVHTLTLEQFLHVNNDAPPQSHSAARTNGRAAEVNGFENTNEARKARSMSLGATNNEIDMSERMKHTRDFKKKGFKSNSRGNFIQAPFTTLEEMFTKLPESIGFNIEIKYPMLHESEEQEMDAYAVELNSFVDTVLTKVYDLGAKRNVIFSSFNPDVCLMLSFKQPSIPILFLTDAGTSAVGDIRASSLQEAIRFASRWNLLGVVTGAEPLVLAPRLVKVVKESGLVCVSYGSLNNQPDKVKLQVKEGIDAVIVDSVLAIRRGLTDTDDPAPLKDQNGTSSSNSSEL